MKIEMINISKEFDGNVILNDINVQFCGGKMYGILGRNGCGKSVLFKVLCGFYFPNSGSIIVDGIDIVKQKSLLPNTRVLIEKPTFLPDISGFENLKVLANIENKINNEEINKVLDIVNLSEDKNKKYHKYSLGMKQKLGIAQVFMENPKVMILDEPFNGIEKNTIVKLKEYLKQLNKKDKIIIISSHFEDDIYELCDEVYCLEDGQLKKN